MLLVQKVNAQNSPVFTLFGLLYLTKEIPENGIPVNEIGSANQVSGIILTKGMLIAYNGAMNQVCGGL